MELLVAFIETVAFERDETIADVRCGHSTAAGLYIMSAILATITSQATQRTRIFDVEMKGKEETISKKEKEKRDRQQRVRELKYPQFRSSGKWMSSRLLGPRDRSYLQGNPPSIYSD